MSKPDLAEGTRRGGGVRSLVAHGETWICRMDGMGDWGWGLGVGRERPVWRRVSARWGCGFACTRYRGLTAAGYQKSAALWA